MRRCLATATALVVAGSILTPALAAAKERRRVERQDYVLASIRTQHLDYAPVDAPALTFRPRRGDKSVEFRMDDAAEDGVMIEVRQDAARGSKPLKSEGCGNWHQVALVSLKPVEVFLYSGLCTGHEVEATTPGTITAIFSTRSLARKQLQHHH